MTAIEALIRLRREVERLDPTITGDPRSRSEDAALFKCKVLDLIDEARVRELTEDDEGCSLSL